jgi:Sulfotransferase family
MPQSISTKSNLSAQSGDLVVPCEPDGARARLAYLLAASHSGSTLQAMLLGGHPEACTVGELKATNLGDASNYLCACKMPITKCEFWAELAQRMGERGFAAFDICKAGTSIFEIKSSYAQRLLAPLYRDAGMEFVRDAMLNLSPAWRAHLRETQRRNLALVRSLQEVTGAKIVVDSSKLALRLKYLLQIPALEVKVIRFIRDGRAVALTYMDDWNFADSSDPALRGGGSGKYRQPPRRSMAEAAHEWRRSNEAADCLIARLKPTQWMQVRYEDLCLQTEDTMRGVCAFLGLDPGLLRLDFRWRTQHVIGNGMRLDTSSEIRLDERWCQHLKSEDLNVFEQVAGKLNRRYGYV